MNAKMISTKIPAKMQKRMFSYQPYTELSLRLAGILTTYLRLNQQKFKIAVQNLN
jgi:hypothetical protein